MSTKAPDILAYLDYRLFLKDRLEHLQNVNKKFSQRWVALRAGFKAPQLLSMIITGQRNLTKEKALDLAEALKLDASETEYFLLIIELAHTETQAGQQVLLERIKTAFKDGLFSMVPDDGAEIFRDWYYPAIREIVTLAECDGSTAWIAGRLGIPTPDAEEALETLLRIGFLKRLDNGRIARSEPSVGTGRNFYPMFLGAWHMKMLERAFQAITIPREQRHFDGLSFAVARRHVPTLRAAIQRFIRETDAWIEGQGEAREEVFHIHVEMFPLTTVPASASQELKSP